MSKTKNEIASWNQLTSNQRDWVVGGTVASAMMVSAASAFAIARRGALVETKWGRISVGEERHRIAMEELRRELALLRDSTKG